MESKEHQRPPLRPANWVARIGVGVALTLIVTIVFIGTLAWVVRAARRVDPTVVTRPETGYQFPDLKDFDGAEVLSGSRDNGVDLPSFKLSKESWARILSCLTPSEVDRFPAKWSSIGYLKIRTKQGQDCYVAIYDTHGTTLVAFSAGPSFEKHTYYRGGNLSELESALATAYSESRHSQSATKATGL